MAIVGLLVHVLIQLKIAMILMDGLIQLKPEPLFALTILARNVCRKDKSIEIITAHPIPANIQ
jgi:hypothetical protein